MGSFAGPFDVPQTAETKIIRSLLNGDRRAMDGLNTASQGWIIGRTGRSEQRVARC